MSERHVISSVVFLYFPTILMFKKASRDHGHKRGLTPVTTLRHYRLLSFLFPLNINS